MKKFISTLLVLSMAFCLIACGTKSGTGTTTTYTQSQEGASVDVVIQSEDDVVKSMKMITTISTEGIPEDQLSMVDPMLEQITAPFDGIDGITSSSDKGDKAITLTINFDLTKEATLKAMADTGTPGAGSNVDGKLSLKSLTTELEASGYTKK